MHLEQSYSAPQLFFGYQFFSKFDLSYFTFVKNDRTSHLHKKIFFTGVILRFLSFSCQKYSTKFKKNLKCLKYFLNIRLCQRSRNESVLV